MFTGIITHLGKVAGIDQRGGNITFQIESDLASELKIDESISHNGICLTIEKVNGFSYQLTAVQETISKTNIQYWKPGTLLNLEQSLVMTGRLDGHIVQGHVDDICTCVSKKDLQGSWEFTFAFDRKFAPLVIEKGSICLNGVSLTAYDVSDTTFRVSIIPYTYAHTNFNLLGVGDFVNIEFDMLGKYVQRMLSLKTGNYSR